MRDFIGDLIVRLKNAQLARLPEAKMHPYFPKRFEKILHLLYEAGYIRGFNEHWDASERKFVLKVFLKYDEMGHPIMKNLSRISTSGHRKSTSVKALWHSNGNTGVTIISTPKGFMLDRDARNLNLGGEVVFQVN